MEALRIDGLTKNFGGLQVLRGISLAVSNGERVAVIGPNGAGKTTLLSIIAGVQRPSAGRLLMFGRDVTALPPDQRAHLGLGCSFQINRLFFGLTVLDNTMLALHGVRGASYRIAGRPQGYEATAREARQLLEAVELWGRRDEPVAALSYGEQRKLEIVLGLASRPRLLVLDEPTAGLALAEILPFLDTIKGLAAETAVIFTSHDMDVVFGLAHRLVVLSFGELIADGPAQQIRSDPKVQAIYLGAEEIWHDAHTR
jgi:ABC-type branched-subunit amino acid transport system ATPase component